MDGSCHLADAPSGQEVGLRVDLDGDCGSLK
jgi:hypothetical protein